MSYTLDALARTRPDLRLDALAARARAVASAPFAAVAVRDRYLVADGAGFTVEPSERGVLLTAAPGRGPEDERLMEVVALELTGVTGAVFDRHTGRTWPAALLAEWLSVAGLLSGRALAVNEERLARRADHAGLQGFAARADTLARYVATPRATPALRQRVHDELAHYAARPALVWPAARALARMGDFARLEALTRAPASDGAGPDAFVVAAEYGAAALELFATALSDTDINYRRAAARALHRVTAPEVLPLVVRALDDKRSAVREAVLETGFDQLLALAGGPAALAPVLRRLANDPSTTVRKLCARWTTAG